jgi:hemerythrin-like domain-containing protein
VFDQVEDILPRLRSVAEVGTVATILEGLLRSHAQLEVNFAFTALDHALEHKGRLATLHQDHREVDDRIRHVQEAPTCELARERLRVAMRASREHFRWEERELFPVLERTLGLGVLAALGEAFSKATKIKANRTERARRRL